MTRNPLTLYWHDYETSGVDPARDRPVQFAGIRTDAELNILGEPLSLYCRPVADVLPHPEACLITGITPQMAQEKGVVEAEFIAQIQAQLARPGTCGVGYNSIRFDDEVTRFTLYRNFYDPYAREWQNGNSRWDIIDMVRLTHALRPEGIEWPSQEDGKPSFRLELLTAANGIRHEAAHDAMSDVYATIEMARLIRQRQPRLYDFVFEHRNKRMVSQQLSLREMNPVLHVSGMYPGEYGCLAVVVPLAQHPVNQNGVIVYDLRYDPAPLLELDAEQIQQRLFTPVAELPQGMERMALKTVHINKCPVIVPLKTMGGAAAERLQIDMGRSQAHLKKIRAALAAGVDVAGKLAQVFGRREFEPVTDPELALYSGGFFSDADRNTMARLHGMSADSLGQDTLFFEDARLPELLFRYRARNYPHTLAHDERQRWREFCCERLTTAEAGGLSLDAYLQRVRELRTQAGLSARQLHVLDALEAYGQDMQVLLG